MMMMMWKKSLWNSQDILMGRIRISHNRGQALPFLMFPMYSLASWNIRGNSGLDKLCPKVFRSWQWTSNRAVCTKAKACSLEQSLNSLLLYSRKIMECVEDIKINDVNATGLRFTWNQKPSGMDGILKKINRIMANLEFSNLFEGANAFFHPYHISNHTPSILRIPMQSPTRPRMFKFSNVLVQHARFKEIVSNEWQKQVSGFWMFKVVKRLKFLKKPLCKLLYDHGNIFDTVKHLRHELDQVQHAFDSDPSNLVLRQEDVAYLNAFIEASRTEEHFLKQKAKVEWLKYGDTNTAYFRKVVKSQASRNRIDSVMLNNGNYATDEQVPAAFIEHYTAFLGQKGNTSPLNYTSLFPNQISNEEAEYMILKVFDCEIKDAIFSIGDDKSPGPDGYSAAFFKETWDIITHDVTKAIREFFVNGVLLKELNHTIIALIRKVAIAMKINDYRTISCCNVLFKCISKILSNRMKGCLMGLVSLNQSAFVPGRRISNNILLTQELMYNYHLDHVPLRWEERVNASESFTYHRHCAKLKIINLFFAGDLFLFGHGDSSSARVIMDSLEEFKVVSGLTPSLPKSKAYFCNVLNYVKIDILRIIPFEESKLLVKYLGVPLVPSRLVYRDCSELVERVKKRINDWKNKSLSFAEQSFRGFLWCQGDMKRGKAKVAWDIVCLPKDEGGLGEVDSHTYKLQGRSLWDILLRGNMSWGWQKILQVRPLVRYSFWFRLGDGSKVFRWSDNWCSLSPLSRIISNHDIYEAGFQNVAKVKDLVWRDTTNVDMEFSVAAVWESIRPRSTKKSARAIIIKQVLVASCYLIWQERNNRLFVHQKKSPLQIIDSIMSSVRLKLLSGWLWGVCCALKWFFPIGVVGYVIVRGYEEGVGKWPMDGSECPIGFKWLGTGHLARKTNPLFIPIWVCVYNIPMELCNGSRIGKIMSGVGKPLLMDNMTKDRCLKKSSKLDFARVLVEVSANDDLPSSLEIAYPPLGNRPAKVGVLDVKYQWKPPLCTHCKTFGHSTVSCKLRPRTEEEITKKILRDAHKIDRTDADVNGYNNVDDDGFTVVGPVSLNFIESIKEARSRVQDLTSGEIVSLNLLSRTRKLGRQCQMVSAENNTSGPVPQSDQASVFMKMMSVHISSGLVLHQMTSDHNRSELRIHDHSNEPSSSKLVPKVVPLAVKTATSRQELELLFHHHLAIQSDISQPRIEPRTRKEKIV
ncbi:RNA-directed DNA polymerase, eukaryota, reverse transcriptase zinc-binding domain protein [Tanacetum coccineum]